MQRAVARPSIGLCAALWLGASPVWASGRTLTICTPALVPDTTGRLQCAVVATSRVAIDILASIVAEDGANVTDFGTGFRVSPTVTGGVFYAEETAGSFADGARYCRATISGVQLKRLVELSLSAVDADGTVTATVRYSDAGSSPRKGGRCP